MTGCKCMFTVIETTSYGSGRRPANPLSKKVTIKSYKIDQPLPSPPQCFSALKKQPNASNNLEVSPGSSAPMFREVHLTWSWEQWLYPIAPWVEVTFLLVVENWVEPMAWGCGWANRYIPNSDYVQVQWRVERARASHTSWLIPGQCADGKVMAEGPANANT